MHLDILLNQVKVPKILTGLLLFRPHVGNRQFWSVALQPHEELLEENEINDTIKLFVFTWSN
jgi:hypothetical protein